MEVKFSVSTGKTLLTFAALVIVAASWGCTSLPPATVVDAVGAPGKTAPAATLVAPGQELAAAEVRAGFDPACFALVGSGRSMEPLYASGTAIVVREQSFRRLCAGQAVVYRNRRGRFVAHLLVREMENGWVVAGVNNAEADDEPVTTKNFVGVVMAAYASNQAQPATDLMAARQVIRAGVENGARTVALP